MKCKKIFADGRECAASALKGQLYCLFHNKPGRMYRRRSERNEFE